MVEEYRFVHFGAVGDIGIVKLPSRFFYFLRIAFSEIETRFLHDVTRGKRGFRERQQRLRRLTESIGMSTSYK